MYKPHHGAKAIVEYQTTWRGQPPREGGRTLSVGVPFVDNQGEHQPSFTLEMQAKKFIEQRFRDLVATTLGDSVEVHIIRLTLPPNSRSDTSPGIGRLT